MLSRRLNCALFIFALLVVGCGKDTEEKIKDSLVSAEIHLSKKECQQAINLLEGLGRQNTNARYLKNLSSAYACRAGYSTIVYFGSDVKLSTTPSPLGGMTKYSTSLASSTSPLASDSNFKDLQTAIDILLYAGGIAVTTDPRSSERLKYFSAQQAGDINAQLAFMLLVQLGKYMKVYANASAAGVKGAGGLGNNCFTSYGNISVVDVVTALTNQPGACKVVNSSHTELASGVSGRRARLCQGVVLLNNIIEVLPNVIASASGGDLSTISGMTDYIDSAKDALTAVFPAIGTVMTVLSQTNCETDASITLETLESYFAIIFESLIL